MHEKPPKTAKRLGKTMGRKGREYSIELLGLYRSEFLKLTIIAVLCSFGNS